MLVVVSIPTLTGASRWMRSPTESSSCRTESAGRSVRSSAFAPLLLAGRSSIDSPNRYGVENNSTSSAQAGKPNIDPMRNRPAVRAEFRHLRVPDRTLRRCPRGADGVFSASWHVVISMVSPRFLTPPFSPSNATDRQTTVISLCAAVRPVAAKPAAGQLAADQFAADQTAAEQIAAGAGPIPGSTSRRPSHGRPSHGRPGHRCNSAATRNISRYKRPVGRDVVARFPHLDCRMQFDCGIPAEPRFEDAHRRPGFMSAPTDRDPAYLGMKHFLQRAARRESEGGPQAVRHVYGL